jgi:hypothetical protein
VAAKIRERLGIEPEMVHGGYGEFRVLVDGEPVAESGVWGFMGVLPGVASVLESVRRRLGS